MAQIVESLLEPAALSRLVTSAHGHNVVRSLLVTAKPSSVQSLVSFFLMPDCDLFSCLALLCLSRALRKWHFFASWVTLPSVLVRSVAETISSPGYARNRHASLVLESCLEAVNRPDLAEILRPERTALLQRLLSGEDPLFAKVALDRSWSLTILLLCYYTMLLYLHDIISSFLLYYTISSHIMCYSILLYWSLGG